MSFYLFLSSFAFRYPLFHLLPSVELAGEYNSGIDSSLCWPISSSLCWPIDWPIDSSHRYVSRFLCSFIFLRLQMVKYMFVCFEYCCEYCCEMWIFRSLIFVAVNILQVAVNIVVNFWLSLFVYFCLSWIRIWDYPHVNLLTEKELTLLFFILWMVLAISVFCDVDIMD